MVSQPTARAYLLATTSKYRSAHGGEGLPDTERDSGDRRRRPGRPPKPQDGASSVLAAFGVELRGLRTRRALTLHQLADMTGYSAQHIGAVERGKVVPSEAAVLAWDAALLANGRLRSRLAAVIGEQAVIRDRNQSARRAKNPAEGLTPAVRSPMGELARTWIGTGSAR